MPSSKDSKSSGFQSRLKARARVWSANLTKEANKNLGKYISLIRVKTTSQEKNGKLDIVAVASSKRKDAPVARAYEFGSGIHSRSTKRSRFQQGAKGFIRIAPKGKKVLAFFWDKVSHTTPAGKKFRGVSTMTGKALFRYVDHPGVVAANGGRGYMAPAIAKVRKQMREDIPKDIREEVVGSFRRVFKK